MAYDLEEQEQIDFLKAWWKQYGNLVTWLVIAALAAFAGWTGYNSYQKKQAVEASTLYDEVQRAVSLKDNSKVQAATTVVVEKFGRTSYATMASLAAAKSAFDINDLKTAKSQLNWVVEKGSSAEFKAIARLRLAAIALDEKNFDEGYKLLNMEFPADFEADVLDRKADLQLAQNKVNDARVSYKAALDKMGEKHSGRQLVQIKLDAIGGPLEVKSDATPAKK